MFQTFGLTEFLFLYFMAFLGIIGYAIISWARGRDKILVRVKRPGSEVVFLKKPLLDGRTIVMEKQKKGLAWAFTYSQTELVKTGPLGLFRRSSVSVIHGASKAISLNYEGKELEAPTWSRTTAGGFFTASVIKAAGQTGQKLEIPIAVYILIFANLALGLITLFAVTGRINL
jgi:hypothetical protein